jgi:hypothetical protein
MKRRSVRRVSRAFVVALALSGWTPAAEAADLQPRTVAAFDRYVALTEQRLNAPDQPFFWVDAQPAARRTSLLQQFANRWSGDGGTDHPRRH